MVLDGELHGVCEKPPYHRRRLPARSTRHQEADTLANHVRRIQGVRRARPHAGLWPLLDPRSASEAHRRLDHRPRSTPRCDRGGCVTTLRSTPPVRGPAPRNASTGPPPQRVDTSTTCASRPDCRRWPFTTGASSPPPSPWRATSPWRPLRRLAALVADLPTTKNGYTDQFFQARRREPMGAAAEIQRSLLPLWAMNTPQVALAGILEPDYNIAGDSLDYALKNGVLHLVRRGDRALFYTDGLVEEHKRGGGQFGEERLIAAIERGGPASRGAHDRRREPLPGRVARRHLRSPRRTGTVGTPIGLHGDEARRAAAHRPAPCSPGGRVRPEYGGRTHRQRPAGFLQCQAPTPGRPHQRAQGGCSI